MVLSVKSTLPATEMQGRAHGASHKDGDIRTGALEGRRFQKGTQQGRQHGPGQRGSSAVLVSAGCCDMLPNMQCLKTRQTYSLRVLEVPSPRWASLGSNQEVDTEFLCRAYDQPLYPKSYSLSCPQGGRCQRKGGTEPVYKSPCPCPVKQKAFALVSQASLESQKAGSRLTDE